jgi:DNA repair protein RecO (recombination protein O)
VEWISTRAVVLRTRNSGALDRIVTLLTPSRGRIAAVAKSARRSIRRFGGCLELFSEIEAVLVLREGRDIGRIESCVLLEPFEGIRASLAGLKAASAGVELVDRLSHGDEEAAELYSETRRFLRSAACGGGRRALTVFQFRVLAAAGFRPELRHCVACGREAAGSGLKRLFDLHKGGLVCPGCAPPTQGQCINIGGPAREAVMAVLECPEADLNGLDSSVLRECASIASALAAERLGAPLRSLS